MSLAQLALLVAALGAGWIAGLCFAFASFIMRALDTLGSAQAIRSMQSINVVILRSSAMWVWFGTALVGALAVVLSKGEILAGAALLFYLLAALVITGRGNVPLNESLDRIDADSAQADEAWRNYRRRWGRWNALRTLLCTLAAATFILAL